MWCFFTLGEKFFDDIGGCGIVFLLQCEDHSHSFCVGEWAVCVEFGSKQDHGDGDEFENV